jgi:hypothetical protein
VWLAGAGLLGAVSAVTAVAADGSVPVQAAIQAWYQSPQVGDFTATGPAPTKPKATADAWTLHLSIAPNAGVAVFREQSQAHSAVQTLQLTRNGASLPPLATTEYFLANPLVPLGRVAASGTPYAVIINQYELPASAVPGASGPFYNMTWYHDTDMSAVDGFMTGSYSVTAGEGGAARVCLKVDTARVTPQGVTDGVVEGTQVSCFRVTAAGKATLESIDLPVAGQVLQFR